METNKEKRGKDKKISLEEEAEDMNAGKLKKKVKTGGEGEVSIQDMEAGLQGQLRGSQ